MKKVLFAAILSCYLLSMAIVPMNVGNKWYYYCTYKYYTYPPVDTLKFVKVAKVDKDTLDNQILKKKIVNSYSIPIESSMLYFHEEFPLSELWYEQGNTFYGTNYCYMDGAADTTWGDGTKRRTYSWDYFSDTYMFQEWSSWSQGGHSGGGSREIVAKNLGPVHKKERIYGIVQYSYDTSETLVAAIIDGVYLGDSLATTTTSINEPLADVKAPILLSNYPNPFNPTTAITFVLNRAQTAKLVVYNSRGEAVRVLADQYFTTGQHSVNFDGSGLNSGVYFYQLETSGVKTTGKMLMLK